MGIVFRQSVKSSIVVGAGAVLGIIVVLLSTQFLSKPVYGFIGTLTTYALTIGNLLLLGMHVTLAVYIHKYPAGELKRKVLISVCLILPALILCVVTLFYFILKSWVLIHFQRDDQVFMRRYYIWLPLFSLLFIYMYILEQYLGSQMKVAISAFMREVVLRSFSILLIILFGFGYISLDFLVIGSVLIYFIPVLLFYAIALKTEGFGFSFSFKSFSKPEYEELIHFSWYHFLLSISIILMSYMDVILLPLYDHSGFSSVAVYRVAIIFISFLQLPLKAFISASFTVMAKAFNDNDMVKAKDLFIRSSNNILIPTVAIGILLCCNLTNAIDVIKHGYSQIKPVFLILLMGNIINIATGMNDQVLSIAKYYKFNLYLSMLLIALLFVLIRFLVPVYGIYGAAWSTTTVLMIFNIAKCWFIWKKLDMQPFSINTLKILFCALPALAGGYFFPYFFNPDRHVYVHTFLDAIMRSGIILIIYVIMLVWLKPSKDLEEYLATVKKDKRLF